MAVIYYCIAPYCSIFREEKKKEKNNKIPVTSS